MSRGKKTKPEDVFAIMSSWATTLNYSETAREHDMPVTTVRDIVEANKDEPEFVKLREEKREEFATTASRIIEKSLRLLERRITRALMQEYELDNMLKVLGSKKKITAAEKAQLLSKVRELQIPDIRALTTEIGTLYDKKALAENSATENISISVKLPEGIDEYAG